MQPVHRPYGEQLLEGPKPKIHVRMLQDELHHYGEA
jgi:hypothetical protein